MPNNTEMEFNDLQELMQCCDSTLDSLDKLRDQLTKIIAVKKKLSENASSSMVFSQAQDISSATANLEKINLKLPSAISEMKQLCQQVLLLLPQANLQPTTVLGQSNNSSVSWVEKKAVNNKDSEQDSKTGQG